MSVAAPQTFDTVIAGGGIVGAACALACAQKGLRVALVERDLLGSGATAAGMGHIVVMDDSEAQFALTRRSQQLWQALSAGATPINAASVRARRNGFVIRFSPLSHPGRHIRRQFDGEVVDSRSKRL